MMKTTRRWFARQESGSVLALFLCTTLGASLGSPVPSAAQSEVDPWSQLQALTDGFVGEVVTADFVQTFLPAGFSTGDEETGVLHLSVPDCLRWDYDQPYPKTYLICGQEAYTWNEGEPQGRRFVLESDSEPGLDFLRLRIENLENRYSAKPEALDATRLKIVFTPLEPDHGLVQASVVLDMKTHLLEGLTYEDLEGNRTRFDISNYRPNSGPPPFDLPLNIDWLEQ
jgi:outer membrane lipoprotein-sorting protein